MKKKTTKEDSKKKVLLKLPKEIINKIPYVDCYEEQGIIQTSIGNFSKSYYINNINAKIASQMSSSEIIYKLKEFINMFDNSIDFQFSIFNKNVNETDFIKKISMKKRSDDKYEDLLLDYNSLINEKIKYSNNNIKKEKFFTLNIKAAGIDAAVKTFSELDEVIRTKFNKICGIEIIALSLSDRLKVLYNIYNFGYEEDFGKKANYKNTNEEFTIKKMKYMKLTTKDIIGPASIKVKPDYIEFNKTFSRSLFINNLPSYINENIISDITSSTGNMLFSIMYKALDQDKGFDIVNKQISENMEVVKEPRRNIRNERKGIVETVNKEYKEFNEDTYFNNSSIKVFKEAVAVKEKLFLTTITIDLFADSLDELDRNTELLLLSVSKFLFQVRNFTNQQLKGFNSSLPLAVSYVDIDRTLSTEKSARLVPLNTQEILKKNGLYYGINDLNDTLVLLNRSNNISNSRGIVSGTSNSGKTFSNKHEIVNTLLSTNNRVLVFTTTNEYDNLINTFGGSIYDDFVFNLLDIKTGYSNQHEKSYLKKKFFIALFNALKDDKVIGLLNDEINEINETVEYLDTIDYKCRFEELIKYLENKNEVSLLLAGYLKKLPEIYLNAPTEFKFDRLSIFKINDNAADIIICLDFIINNLIDYINMNNDYKNSTWVYIDPIDSVFTDEEIYDYFLEVYNSVCLFNSVITVTIQNNFKLFKECKLELQEKLYGTAGYIKLLNQGPVEREKLAELLNLSPTLLSYISNAETGKGLIITPTTNLALTDELDSIYKIYNLVKIDKD